MTTDAGAYGPSRGATRWSLGEKAGLALAIAAVLIYRWYFIRFYDVMSADGTGYATAGKAFFDSWNPGSFGTIFPPLYPFFIGLFNRVVGDLESSARLVSVLFSSLTLGVVYAMAREFFGRRTAVGALALCALLPFLHGMAGIDIAEPIYTFFAFSGAYLSWRAFAGGRWLPMAGAGALFSCAYLARPEGFVLLVAFTALYLAIALLERKQHSVKRVLLLLFFWGGFFLVASPYLVYLHGATGAWQLSGKTAINTSVIKEYRGLAQTDSIYKLNAKGEMAPPNEGSPFRLMLNDPSLFWGNLRENMHKFPEAFEEAFPSYLWPLVIIGFLCTPWREEQLRGKAFLAILASPLLLYVIFYIVSRYLYPYVPLLLILAAAGLTALEGWLRGIAGKPVRSFGVAVPVVCALSAYYLYLEYPRPRPPYDYRQDGARYDDKQIGIRLRTIIPEKAVIMTRSGRIAFYVDRPWVRPPQEGFDQIMAYARKNKVQYLIANMLLLATRPQMEPLFKPLLEPKDPFQPPPGLELIYAGAEPGGLPYLVYRLK